MGVKDAAFTSSVRRFISERGAQRRPLRSRGCLSLHSRGAASERGTNQRRTFSGGKKYVERKPLFPLEVRGTERRGSPCPSPRAPRESGGGGALGNRQPQRRGESFYRLRGEGGGEKRKQKKKNQNQTKREKKQQSPSAQQPAPVRQPPPALTFSAERELLRAALRRYFRSPARTVRKQRAGAARRGVRGEPPLPAAPRRAARSEGKVVLSRVLF